MLLHAQIETNKRKTWVLAAVFLALFLGVGASLGVLWFDNAWPGIVLALVIGSVYVAFMTRAGANVVMAMNRAQQITSEDDNPFLWNTVEALAIAARVPMPKVYIIDDPSPNAFAAGWSPKNSAVAVTKGLLERLNRQEIEGVLAHEMAHIQNYDVRLATTAIALVAVIGILGDMGRRMLWYGGYGGGRRRSSGRDGQGQGAAQLIALLFLLLAPIAAIFVQMAISRNREYLADASGAELCRNPEALASALRKISAAPEPVRAASSTSAALYIVDPLKKGVRRGLGDLGNPRRGDLGDPGQGDLGDPRQGPSEDTGRPGRSDGREPSAGGGAESVSRDGAEPGGTGPTFQTGVRRDLGPEDIEQVRMAAARNVGRSSSANWFSTHPPTEERIRRLEQMM